MELAQFLPTDVPSDGTPHAALLLVQEETPGSESSSPARAGGPTSPAVGTEQPLFQDFGYPQLQTGAMELRDLLPAEASIGVSCLLVPTASCAGDVASGPRDCGL